MAPLIWYNRRVKVYPVAVILPWCTPRHKDTKPQKGIDMLQNDMKKGQLGVLKNGWKFRIEDNLKGNVRRATVWGYNTEMGSIYTSDIELLEMPDGTIEPLEQTSAQAKQSAKVGKIMDALFGN